MGTKLKEILVKRDIEFEDLEGKKIVIDSFNIFFQFLSSIRQRDGSLLTDSKGNVTSHLVGLFTRTAKLLQYKIMPIFVFDGVAPALKKKEIERRTEIKKEAEIKYREAVEKENIEEMKKYLARTTRLTDEMIEEAKRLISAMGLPIVQAPSEGEAQAAYIVNKGEAYAMVSQDYDSLLFGVKRLIQNLTVSERKKLPGRYVFERVKPVMIDLDENLKLLEIDREQLIVLGMLVGTDYNIGGIKGIGPKNALKLVKRYGHNFDALFRDVKWDLYFDYPWNVVFDLIINMPTTDEYHLEWKRIDREKIIKLLCDEHDFNKERVLSILKKIDESTKKEEQKSLGRWS